MKITDEKKGRFYRPGSSFLCNALFLPQYRKGSGVVPFYSKNTHYPEPRQKLTALNHVLCRLLSNNKNKLLERSYDYHKKLQSIDIYYKKDFAIDHFSENCDLIGTLYYGSFEPSPAINSITSTSRKKQIIAFGKFLSNLSEVWASGNDTMQLFDNQRAISFDKELKGLLYRGCFETNTELKKYCDEQIKRGYDAAKTQEFFSAYHKLHFAKLNPI